MPYDRWPHGQHLTQDRGLPLKITAAINFYVTGGTLPPGAPSYVERQADCDRYEGLQRGEYYYVLHARPMGKSSLWPALPLERAEMATLIGLSTSVRPSPGLRRPGDVEEMLR